MHILYLHQYFASPDDAGGTRSYEMARRWVRWGHRVTVVTSSARFRTGRAPRAGRSAWRTYVDGIEVVVLPVAYRSEMSPARRIAAFVEFGVRASRWAMQIRADVVFATSTPLTIAIPGRVGASAGRVPMVFEVRDLWPELPIAMGALEGRLAIRSARELERWAYRGAAQVIALSPGMADGIARSGVDPACIHVVPNACDVDSFIVEADEARAYVEQTIPGPGPLVVYAGSFGAINDAAWLVEVAAYAPEIRFAFVGEGPGRSSIESRARALGLLNRSVFVRAPIPKREIPLLLGGATVATSLFLPVPAMEHNSANKFFDALASKTPIAINYGGWQADLLAQTGAGLVLDRRDVEGAASQLRRAVFDAQWLADASRAAASLATSTFDRDRLARKALDVVERSADG